MPCSRTCRNHHLRSTTATYTGFIMPTKADDVHSDCRCLFGKNGEKVSFRGKPQITHKRKDSMELIKLSKTKSWNQAQDGNDDDEHPETPPPEEEKYDLPRQDMSNVSEITGTQYDEKQGKGSRTGVEKPNLGDSPSKYESQKEFQGNPGKYQFVTEILPPVPTSGPPPPPEGGEELWDLQFCKWWGWNWVKRRDLGDNEPYPNHPVRFSYPGYAQMGKEFRKCPCGSEYMRTANGKFDNFCYGAGDPSGCQKFRMGPGNPRNCNCQPKKGFCRRLLDRCLCKKEIVRCDNCNCGTRKIGDNQPQFCKCCRRPEKLTLCECRPPIANNFQNMCQCVRNPQMMCRRSPKKCYRESCRHYDVRRKNNSDSSICAPSSFNSIHDDIDKVSVKLHERNKKIRRYVCYPTTGDKFHQKAVRETNGYANKEGPTNKVATNYLLQSYWPNLSKLDLEKKLSKFGKPYNTFSWLDKQMNDRHLFRDEFHSPLSGKTYSLNIANVTSSNFMKTSCLPEPMDPRSDNYFQVTNTRYNQYIRNDTYMSPLLESLLDKKQDKNDLANLDILQDVKFNLTKIETLMNKLLKDKSCSENQSDVTNWTRDSPSSATRNERELNVIERSSVCASSKNSIRACKRSLSDISIPVQPKKIKVLPSQRPVNEVFQRMYEYFDSGEGVSFGTIENLMITPLKSPVDPEMAMIEEEMDELSQISKDVEQQRNYPVQRRHSLHSATTFDINCVLAESPHTNISADLPLDMDNTPKKRQASMIPVRKKQ